MGSVETILCLLVAVAALATLARRLHIAEPILLVLGGLAIGFIPEVANVEFSFTRALRGSDGRSLDLIILVDTTTGDFGDRNAGRVRQRVEALSRALDVTGSRYVVTVILMCLSACVLQKIIRLIFTL